ncbi:MAG: DUF928 domain-containing protein [Cyanobacteria bacterium P01_F01_bin.150]
MIRSLHAAFPFVYLLQSFFGGIPIFGMSTTSLYKSAHLSLEDSLIYQGHRGDVEHQGSGTSGAPYNPNCENDEPMIAIGPGFGDKTYLSRSMMVDPSLWFFFPYDTLDNAQFEILDSNFTEIEAIDKNATALSKMTLHGQILQIHLSREVGNFNDQIYRWSLAVDCETFRSSVSGNIRFIDTTNTLPSDPDQKAKELASRGLWGDSFTTVFNEICDFSNAELARQRFLELWISRGNIFNGDDLPAQEPQELDIDAIVEGCVSNN